MNIPASDQEHPKIYGYCGKCRKRINKTKQFLKESLGKRLVCENEKEGGPKHFARVVKGPAGEFWVRRASNILQYEARYAPHHWFKCFEGRAGRWLCFRFAFLVGMVHLTWVLLDKSWSCPVMTVCVFVAGGFAADILLVNTSTSLVSRNWQEPLRSAVFLLFSFVQLALCFSVFYLAATDWFNSGDEFRRNPIGAVYFSFVTIATLGYGDIYPNKEIDAWLGQLIVVFQILTSFYFIGLLATTIVGLWSREDNSLIGGR